MKLFLIVSLGLVLSACTSPETDPDPDSYDYTPVAVAGEFATLEERAACEVEGGWITGVGMAGYQACVQHYPDAGETCTDSDQCLGRCEVVGDIVTDLEIPITGQCQLIDIPFGCYQLVEDGKAGPGGCVD